MSVEDFGGEGVSEERSRRRDLQVRVSQEVPL